MPFQIRLARFGSDIVRRASDIIQLLWRSETREARAGLAPSHCEVVPESQWWIEQRVVFLSGGQRHFHSFLAEMHHTLHAHCRRFLSVMFRVWHYVAPTNVQALPVAKEPRHSPAPALRPHWHAVGGPRLVQASCTGQSRLTRAVDGPLPRHCSPKAWP